MSASVQWLRDENGNDYYWAPAENCYIYYPSGRRYYPATKRWTEAPSAPAPSQRIPRAAAEIPSQPAPTSNRVADRDPQQSGNLSRTVSSQHYTTQRERQTSLSSGGSNGKNTGPSPVAIQQLPSASYGSAGQGSWQATVTTNPALQGYYSKAPAGGGPSLEAGASSGQATYQTAPTWTASGGDTSQAGSAPRYRDWQPPSSAKSGSSSARGHVRQPRREIHPTPGEYEKLDPRYKRRKSKFFQSFRVFKMHWAQPAEDTNATVVTEREGEPLPKEYQKMLPKDYVRDRRFGQHIYTKIRWFIVVREGKDSCLCVPISTYEGRGVEKDVIKSEHAIAHISREPPPPDPREAPKRGERPMRTPIRIQTDEKGDKLAPMSRIDYGRVYTVEQNIKALAFGWVHDDSRKDFQFDFLNVFMGEEGYKAWEKQQKQTESDEESEDSNESNEAEEDEDSGEDEGSDDKHDNNNDDHGNDGSASRRPHQSAPGKHPSAGPSKSGHGRRRGLFK